MISIGVTGGIGSGKTVVCQILEHLGYPVFYSDEVAKENMLNNLDLINAIVQTFGEKAYIDKQLNRNYLASEIFSKPVLKEKLNALVHPTVFQSFEQWREQQQASIIFNESALLFETGSYKRFDYVWLIVADRETRTKRIQKRDGSSYEEIQQKINNQLSDEEKMRLTKFLIHNSENDALLPQILALLENLNKVI